MQTPMADHTIYYILSEENRFSRVKTFADNLVRRKNMMRLNEDTFWNIFRTEKSHPATAGFGYVILLP